MHRFVTVSTSIALKKKRVSAFEIGKLTQVKTKTVKKICLLRECEHVVRPFWVMPRMMRRVIDKLSM